MVRGFDGLMVRALDGSEGKLINFFCFNYFNLKQKITTLALLSFKKQDIMPKINRFEDLECWKTSRKLTLSIYQLKGEIVKDYGLIDQLRRASLSIMNNIAKGFGRFSNKEKIRFLEIAQSSANEVGSMFYLLEDLSYLDPTEIAALRELLSSGQKQTWGLIKYLKKSTIQPT